MTRRSADMLPVVIGARQGTRCQDIATVRQVKEISIAPHTFTDPAELLYSWNLVNVAVQSMLDITPALVPKKLVLTANCH